MLSEVEMNELRELANEAKLRGVEFFGLDVDDWRDVPTSQSELDEMPQGPKKYWQAVASQLANR